MGMKEAISDWQLAIRTRKHVLNAIDGKQWLGGVLKTRRFLLRLGSDDLLIDQDLNVLLFRNRT